MDARSLLFLFSLAIFAQAQQAHVSLANAISNAVTPVTFEFVLTGTAVPTAFNVTVAYKDFTQSTSVTPGVWNVTLIESGSVLPNMGVVTVEANKYYIVAAAGVVSNPVITPATDDLTNPQNGEYVRIRAFNLVLNAPTFTIVFAGQSVNFTVSSNQFSDYIEIPAGPVQVAIYQPGSTIPVRVDTITFVGGSVTTLFLEGGSVANTTVYQQVAATYEFVTVRFAHFVVAAPNYDVYLGEKLIVSNIGYKGVSPAVNLLFNTTVTLKAVNSQTVVTSFQVDIQSNNRYLISALGDLATLKPVTVVDDVVPADTPSFGRVRLVHGNSGLGPVNVYVNNVLFNPTAIDFGNITDSVQVGVATYNVTIRSPTDVILVPVFNFNVSSGQNIVIFVSGSNVTNVEATASITVAYSYAYVRFAHMALDAPAARLQLDPYNAVIAQNNIYSANITYGNFTEYQQIVLATYFTATWTIADSTTWLATSQLVLENQRYYTLTLEGTYAGVEPLRVGYTNDTLVYTSSGTQSAQISFYNQVSQGVKDGKNVNIDMYIDGTKYASNVPFSAQSAPVLIPWGYYTITFTLVDSTELILPGATLQLGSESFDGATGVVGIWLAGEYFNTSQVANKVTAFVNSNAKYSHLRVNHAITNAPAGVVSVTISTPYGYDQVTDNVAFGTISNYFNFPTAKPSQPNLYTLGFSTPAGLFATVPYNATSGDDLVVAYGYYGNSSAPIQSTVLHGYAAEPKNPNEYTIRFIHAVPFIGTATINWNGNSVETVAYGSASSWFVQPVDEIYRLDVVIGGNIVFTVVNQTFVSGGVYEYILADYPTPRPFAVLENQLNFFRIRLIHAIVGAPAVTVNIDGQTNVFGGAISYGFASAYLWVESGSRDLYIIRSDTGAILTTITINATTATYNVIASNDLATARFDVVQAEVVVPTSADSSIRFINLDSRFPINIEVNANNTLVPNLGYLNQTEYQGIPSGLTPFEIQVATNNGTKQGLGLITPRLTEGVSYSFFVMPNTTNPMAAFVLLTEDYAPPVTAQIRYINAYHQAYPNNGSVENQVGIFANYRYVATLPYQAATGYYATALTNRSTDSVVPIDFKVVSLATSLSAVNVSVTAALTYTVFVYPVAGAVRSVAVQDNVALPAAGKIRVYLINLIDGLPILPEVKFGDNVAFTNVVYGTQTNYTEVDQGVYSVQFNNNSQQLFAADTDLRSSDSAVYTLAAIGTPANFKVVSLLDAGVGSTTPSTSSDKATGLAGWIIALIVVGVILLVAAVAVAGWMIYKRRHAGYSTIPERDA